MGDIRRDLLLDKRLVKRHMERGLLPREDYEKHIGDLPDRADKAKKLDSRLESVGVESVARKHTGDQE